MREKRNEEITYENRTEEAREDEKIMKHLGLLRNRNKAWKFFSEVSDMRNTR